MAGAEIIAEAQKHVLHGTGTERELLWRTSLRTSLATGARARDRRSAFSCFCPQRRAPGLARIPIALIGAFCLRVLHI